MKNPNPIFLGNSPFQSSTGPTRAEFVMLQGEPHICIRHVNRLSPFLMSIVSDSDHWLFVGSNSPFTAGRVDSDHALFPYQTVDKILRYPDTGGSLSFFLVRTRDHWALWEPWQASGSAY